MFANIQTTKKALRAVQQKLKSTSSLLLNNFLSRAAVAQSPAEANALVKYTKTWTEEQPTRNILSLVCGDIYNTMNQQIVIQLKTIGIVGMEGK